MKEKSLEFETSNFTIESCTNKKSSKNENQRKWKISTILAILFTFVSYYYHVVNWLLYNFALFLLHFLRKWKIKLHSWIASRARVQSRVEYETYIIFNIQFVLIFFFYISPIFLYSQRRRICCCWASLPHARRYDVDVFFQSVKWDRVDNPATILTSNNTYIFLDTHFFSWAALDGRRYVLWPDGEEETWKLIFYMQWEVSVVVCHSMVHLKLWSSFELRRLGT